jgi:hypothetical protein
LWFGEGSHCASGLRGGVLAQPARAEQQHRREAHHGVSARSALLGAGRADYRAGVSRDRISPIPGGRGRKLDV